MMHQINPLNLEQKIGLKYMMNQEEQTMLIAKTNLKLQCQNLAYVIMVMQISLLNEKQQWNRR